jgi:hypothetical protein
MVITFRNCAKYLIFESINASIAGVLQVILINENI